MVDSLSKKQANFLTWLVLFLLAFMGFVAGWSKYESALASQNLVNLERSLPEKYVTLERYKCDIDRVERILTRIETKIDSMGKNP